MSETESRSCEVERVRKSMSSWWIRSAKQARVRARRALDRGVPRKRIEVLWEAEPGLTGEQGAVGALCSLLEVECSPKSHVDGVAETGAAVVGKDHSIGVERCLRRVRRQLVGLIRVEVDPGDLTTEVADLVESEGLNRLAKGIYEDDGLRVGMDDRVDVRTRLIGAKMQPVLRRRDRSATDDLPAGVQDGLVLQLDAVEPRSSSGDGDRIACSSGDVAAGG